MKLLFVNPYIYDFTAYDLWLRPLGLLYIAAAARKYTNCDIYWLDALDRFQPGAGVKPGNSGRGKYHREIVEKPSIYSETPRNYARYGMPYAAFREKLERLPEIDMILVAALMTYWIDGLNFTLNALIERFPRADIVIGGTLPTLVAQDSIAAHVSTHNAAVRFIAGYGEKQILEVIEQNGGRVYTHPDFSDLDNIPYPAFDLLADRSVLPLLTSRGCPFRCTYCASNLLNERFLERDPEKILAEIEYMHEMNRETGACSCTFARTVPSFYTPLNRTYHLNFLTVPLSFPLIFPYTCAFKIIKETVKIFLFSLNNGNISIINSRFCGKFSQGYVFPY
jgi:hypothetical protein